MHFARGRIDSNPVVSNSDRHLPSSKSIQEDSILPAAYGSRCSSSRLATCTNRHPTCRKLISCPTFHWTNPPLPLLNAVARLVNRFKSPTMRAILCLSDASYTLRTQEAQQRKRLPRCR